jgi:DNA repair photolyase
VSAEVRYHEVEAKTVLRRAAVVDPWFLGRYGSNLYRGCEHGCAYCDGRAERYYVPGDFARDIQVKRNALALAADELRRLREPGFLFVGGGVCDAYQPAEAKYRLARGLLELCRERRVPVHVLTKSALVERDLDLLAAINADTRAVLSFSIATTEEQNREAFEPGAAPLAERWRLLAAARGLGISTAVMAMPILPGLGDAPEALDALVETAKRAGVDFLCYGGLTLRSGIQKDGFLAVLERAHPDLVPGYRKLYAAGLRSGAPDRRYLERLDGRCRAALAKHGMPGRMPWHIFHGLVPTYTELAVLLEHRGFARGEPGGGGGALARAGLAVAEWASARLARQRGKQAFRLVESELHLLMRGRQLHDIPGLDPSRFADVEACYADVCRPVAGRDGSAGRGQW